MKRVTSLIKLGVIAVCRGILYTRERVFHINYLFPQLQYPVPLVNVPDPDDSDDCMLLVHGAKVMGLAIYRRTDTQSEGVDKLETQGNLYLISDVVTNTRCALQYRADTSNMHANRVR